MISEIPWPSPEQTEPWLSELAREIRPGLILTLNGGLGAGKTTLLRALLAKLGGSGLASPTYAYHHRYATRLGAVDHFDLYRLSRVEEMESVGLFEALADPQAIVWVEWSSRLPESYWPAGRPRLDVTILETARGGRRILFKRLP